MLQYFKISFYANSHVDKLFGERKRVGYFIIIGVVMRRDDARGMMVKGNDDGKCSSDDVML
jgi:hypothetical protein